uniref:Uncharacterized protein n=1 Tax=Erpetoichthys calabaricus TaxID=27687 RepID=A0A8C4RSI7_ERPCA
MEVLSDLERLRVSVVLEDCLEQLAILGRSLPTSSKPSFGDIRSSRSEMRGDHLGDMTSDHSMTRDLDETTFSTTDGLLKVQWDRQFAEAVIKDTLQEVRSTGTFHKLLQAVEMEMDQKAGLQDIIASEEESRQRIKLLQRKLQEIREEKEQEVQRRNEMIAHLKDQRQEKKAKMILEEKYTKKNAELQVFQEQKKCQEQEQDLKNQIEHLKNKTAEELIVHKEMEEFLKKYQTVSTANQQSSSV